MKILIVVKSKKKLVEISQYVKDCYPNSCIINASNERRAKTLIERENFNIDICFIEVLKRDPYGLKLAEDFSDIGNHMTMIFLADCKDFALKAWDLGVRDYLLEPITLESIRHTMSICLPQK